MKQFSLEEFKKNPNRKVVTKKGRPVRIICTDAVRRYPIIALVKFNKEEELNSYLPDGRWSFANENGDMNLFFAPEKKEGYINLYRTKLGIGMFNSSFYVMPREDAEIEAAKYPDDFIATAKVTWEE